MQRSTEIASTRFGSHARRVVYVVSKFPCLSETFIVREIQALVEQGVDIRILSLKPATGELAPPQPQGLMDRVVYPARFSSNLAAAVRLLIRQPRRLGAFALMLIRGLWREPLILGKSLVSTWRGIGRLALIRDFSPQLIHAPWATYPATVAWFLSRELERPFSFTSRAHDIFLKDHMMSRKLREAALAVTITDYNVRLMAKWLPPSPPLPIHVVHSAVNPEELPFIRTSRPRARLLAVGRLVPMKGFDVLLRALAVLRHKGLAFHCTIVGEGPERPALERLASELSLYDVVDLIGAQTPDQVKDKLATSTLMVMPCIVAPDGSSDGIPNVLIEAMASGLPVISTHISGIPELIDDDVSGLLVEPGNHEALAHAIADLLEDPDRQARYALAGRRKVEQDFDVRVEAGRLRSHFEAVCHG